MAKQKTKLELTWIGKENRPKLEPRILIEDPGKSYHAAQRHSENDIFDNRLIFSDNLLALKDVANVHGGVAKVAQAAKLNRESMYHMLSENGNPTVNSLNALLHTLGLRLTITHDKSRPASAAR